MNLIDIQETFIELTKHTTPHGTEDTLYHFLKRYNLSKDEFGNYYRTIRTKSNHKPNTMFCSHLDTISYEEQQGQQQVKHVFIRNFITTNGRTILGADDKAGVTLMLNMISHSVPGLYYFFVGEEDGCIGSFDVARNYRSLVNDMVLPSVNKCIAFDRRGYTSIITHQRGERCASPEFANALAKQLNQHGFNYALDNSGNSSDSAEFMAIISECTNISVGYFNEHTTNEHQDIDFLEKLSFAVCKVDWENLPIELI